MLLLNQGLAELQEAHLPQVLRRCIPQTDDIGLPDDPASPPSVNLLTHWLRVSFPHGELPLLVDTLDFEFGEHEFRDWGRWGYYNRSFAWSNGVEIQCQSDARRYERSGGMMTMEIPGRVLEQRPLADNATLFKKIDLHLTPRCGRIDLKAQDFERVITPRELWETVYAEDVTKAPVLVKKGLGTKLCRPPLRRDFTGFERISYRADCNAHDGCEYDQVMFGKPGSRGSGKCLVVYDKWLESGGQVVSVDWELRLYGTRADAMFRHLCQIPTEEWGQAIATAITASIDFRQRDAIDCKNVKRCPRYDWWEDLCERIGSGDADALAMACEPKSVPKSFDYVTRQAMGSIQTCYVALGRNRFLRWLLDQVVKEDRITKRHREAIGEYRAFLKSQDKPMSILEAHDFFAERGFDLDPYIEPPDEESDG